MNEIERFMGGGKSNKIIQEILGEDICENKDYFIEKAGSLESSSISPIFKILGFLIIVLFLIYLRRKYMDKKQFSWVTISPSIFSITFL